MAAVGTVHVTLDEEALRQRLRETIWKYTEHGACLAREFPAASCLTIANAVLAELDGFQQNAPKAREALASVA